MNGSTPLRLAAPLAWLALLPPTARAHAAPPAPPLPTPAGNTSAHALPTAIPVEIYEHRIYLPVTIDGRGPYRFCLDTGAPSTCIDLSLARMLGILEHAGGRIGGAGEGTSERGRTSAVSLGLTGLSLRPRPLMAIDFSPLTQFQGRPIHGLIGNDFFRGRIIEIDYAAARMTIHPAGFEYDGPGIVLPTRLHGYTFIEALLTPPGAQPLPARCMLDTGAGLALAATTPFARRHRLAEAADWSIEATTGFGVGGEVRQTLCRMEAIQLGDLRFDLPLIGLSDDRTGALATSRFDVLVGGGFLHKFRVIFDGPGRRLILEPNDAFPEPLEFDMSGLTLAAALPPHSGLRILRVLDGSPAAEAGLRPGDILIELDGRSVGAADREPVRRLLRRHGEIRRLRLLRDGRLLEASITLRRLVSAPRHEPQPPPTTTGTPLANAAAPVVTT